MQIFTFVCVSYCVLDEQLVPYTFFLLNLIFGCLFFWGFSFWVVCTCLKEWFVLLIQFNLYVDLVMFFGIFYGIM